MEENEDDENKIKPINQSTINAGEACRKVFVQMEEKVFRNQLKAKTNVYD